MTTNQKARILTESAGWYGMLAIITAYGLVSFDMLSTHDVLYQILNLSGALGIIVVSYAHRVKQSVILNVFWAAIALLALMRMSI